MADLGLHPRLCASTVEISNEELDLIAIERAISGEPVTLTLPEKVEAARLLDARGYTHSEIGRRVGSFRGTIARWKNNGWALAPATILKQQPPVCGDKRMYDLHIRRGETPCTACKQAAAADRLRRKDEAKNKSRPPVCGEARMYRLHLNRGESPCTACRAANAAADRRYRPARTQPLAA